ncbi:hypothetical protein AURDEDRAFT_131633, partial [Auricularia subglabra TFB-10046 SS5]
MLRDALGLVPPELWCQIWAFLPMEDIVAASQTCKAWRSAALGCPTLWREVDYITSLHAEYCDCTTCGVDEFSNLPLVREVLPRSAILPLAVNVFVLRDHSNTDDQEQFAELLRPQLHRLRKLLVRTLDYDVA